MSCLCPRENEFLLKKKQVTVTFVLDNLWKKNQYLECTGMNTSTKQNGGIRM